jgi:hypothetical protein
LRRDHDDCLPPTVDLGVLNPQYIETGEERVWEVKGSHVFAEGFARFISRRTPTVVCCLVRKPDPIDIPEVGVTDPRFVDTVEMLFMSYYGEHIVGIPLHLSASGLQRFAARVA